jgi:hypothetical protein
MHLRETGCRHTAYISKPKYCYSHGALPGLPLGWHILKYAKQLSKSPLLFYPMHFYIVCPRMGLDSDEHVSLLD